MSFGTLALLVLAGLIGPALAATHRAAPPAVVGEILAGLVIGQGGLGWVDPTDPALNMLAAIGFAMLMFIVGTHLPVRDPSLRPAFGRGAGATAAVGVFAMAGALAVWKVSGFDQFGVLVVLISTSSAAVALPVLQGLPNAETAMLITTSWIAIADVATVLAIPLVMATGRIGDVLLGGVIVVASAAAVYVLGRQALAFPVLGPRVRSLREQSRKRGWALDLRVSVLVLFSLAWAATRFGTSVLLAGFATGVVVALLGEPRRVAQQLVGLGEGFFVPLFFVVLGARLDLSALLGDGKAMLLGVGILAASTAAHLLAAAAWRLPLASGMIATAQLGVPAAVVSLGLQSRTITPAQGGAIMAATLGSMAVCAVGASRLGQPEPITDHSAPNLR